MFSGAYMACQTESGTESGGQSGTRADVSC